VNCPTCGEQLPVDPRYVTWCDSCGWNLRGTSATETPTTSLDRIAESVGRRLGDRMAERLSESAELAPKLTPAKFAAYVIALAVHAFVLVLVVSGVWLLVGDTGLFVKIAGALLLGLAFLMRPRLGKRVREGIVRREEAPTLYGLADDVAAALGTRRVDVIAITSEYNASWSVNGFRRERTLTLGLPLLAVLDPDEQIALIGHELGHARNGDVTRGLVVGSAVESLAELYETMRSESEDSDLDFAELVVRPIMWLLAQPFRLLLLLELHLLLQDRRRAEYLADRLAATVAGAQAEIRSQEKTLLAQTVESALHRYAVRRDASDGDVFDAMREAIADVPERERERRHRIARLEGTRLGATHPPTAKRIELLERLPAATPLVAADPERAATALAEVAGLRKRLSRQLVEEYRMAVAG
jgi:Zn-dependent protease with chaperone function